MLALDAILSTSSTPVAGTGRTLCALIDNKALISRIQKWHHQGQAGTLAPEYDLLQVAQGVISALLSMSAQSVLDRKSVV